MNKQKLEVRQEEIWESLRQDVGSSTLDLIEELIEVAIELDHDN